MTHVSIFAVFPPLFDILEYANVATLHNVLPVYYTLYEAWQSDSNDAEMLSVMKKEFLTVLNAKYRTSLTILHFVATFVDPSPKHFRFVKNIDDRDCFFRQVRQSTILHLQVVEESKAVTAETPAAEPPAKKMKLGLFDWLLHSADSQLVKLYNC